jgi:hypothetical protein
VTSSVDYYSVLDIGHNASKAEIKTAYRRAAKAAHPDAGGDVVTMELVNEAYAALSDPVAKRSYDATRSPVSPKYHAEVPVDVTWSKPRPHSSSHYSTRYHPAIIAAARASALRIIGYNLAAAVLLGFITSFFARLTTNFSSQAILAIVAFVPIYLSAVGVVFLAKPHLRIALAHFGMARLPPRHDLLTLIGVGLFAFPLAAIWVVGYFSGILR